jgi:SNF family Na+-dependent transporter
VLCFDAAIDTFGNLSGPWGVSEEEPDRVDRYLADLLGAPQSAASLDASGMTVLAGDGDLRPRGPVLVAFAVFWFLVQRFLRLELRGLMALVRIAAPVAALILLMLGLLLVGLRVGATHGLAALFTPAPLADGGGRFWCWALAAPILASGLGTGVLIGFTGGRPRTGDATGLGTAAFAFVLVIQVLVLAVVVAGLGVAAVAVDAEAGQLDPHPARILLGHMPLALSGSTGPPWLDGLPVLAWLAVVVVLCLISCIALLIGPLQALRRAFDGYSEEFAMRLSAAALLISLPFATGLGWDGWAFFALLLGSIILPAAIVAQVFASAVAVGLDGLVDHVRAYSTIPLGFLWRMTMIAIPAVMVILVVVGALVLLTAAWADGPRAIVFALVPAVALPLAGWLTVKRRRRRA